MKKVGAKNRERNIFFGLSIKNRDGETNIEKETEKYKVCSSKTTIETTQANSKHSSKV